MNITTEELMTTINTLQELLKEADQHGDSALIDTVMSGAASGDDPQLSQLARSSFQFVISRVTDLLDYEMDPSGWAGGEERPMV